MCWIFDPKILKCLEPIYISSVFFQSISEVVVKHYSLFYKWGTNEAERDLRDLLQVPEQVENKLIAS